MNGITRRVMQHSNIQSIAETDVCHAMKVKTDRTKVRTKKSVLTSG